MNINKISTVLSDVTLKGNVGIAVLNKNIDTMENTGKQVVKMIEAADLERSVNPHIGENIDLFI